MCHYENTEENTKTQEELYSQGRWQNIFPNAKQELLLQGIKLYFLLSFKAT